MSKLDEIEKTTNGYKNQLSKVGNQLSNSEISVNEARKIFGLEKIDDVNMIKLT